MSGENSEITTKFQNEIQLGDFQYSLQTNELTDETGELIRLRRQSNDVLAAMAERCGQIVSKTELIEKVWPDTFVTDDSLGQCIVDIRRVLKDTEHRIVQTFHKKGYMLVASTVSGAVRGDDARSEAGSVPAMHQKPFRLVALAGLFLIFAAIAVWQSWNTIVGAPQMSALELPEGPSIVVLPFDNQSEKDELEYLAAGFSTSIRTQLSKFPQLFVIAGSTALTFKDSPGTARGIGRELGVRYVLDGSVRVVGGDVVVNTELIETETEQSVWAQQYAFATENRLSVQADLVQEITSTLNVVIGEEEVASVRLRSTENPRAYDLFMRAEAATQSLTPDGRIEAIELLNEAIALDPDYLAAHFELSGRYLSLWRFGNAEDPKEAVRLARHHAERALEISRSDYRGHFRLGMLHLFADHDHELAYAAFLRALSDNPNDADVLYNVGFLRSLMGEPAEAIEWNNKAKRINPRYPGWYNFNPALSHFFLEDYELALILAKTGIAAYPQALPPRRILIATLVELGRLGEAKSEVEEYMAINPEFRLSTFRNTPFQHRADQDRYFAAMRMAGIPD